MIKKMMIAGLLIWGGSRMGCGSNQNDHRPTLRENRRKQASRYEPRNRA